MQIVLVFGLGPVFVSPRTGTLFMFSEQRQHWHDHQCNVWVGMMTIEVGEDPNNLMRAADIFINLPTDQAFYTPLLLAPNAFHNLQSLPRESTDSAMASGFRFDRA